MKNILKKKVKEPTMEEKLIEKLAESVSECIDKVSIHASKDNIAELESLCEQYTSFLEKYNEKNKIIMEDKGKKRDNIVSITTTGMASVTSVILTLMTFGYETSGNGNIFTTVGRNTIGNVLKSIKK